MKTEIFICIAAMLVLATGALADDTSPYSLASYGNFKQMIHTQKTDGAVGLANALGQSNLYAVGATAHGTGEITVIDGKLWLDYGADGPGNAIKTAPQNEEAVILVSAEVKDWAEVSIPKDMTATEVEGFILTEASRHSIDISKPFPFLLKGRLFNFQWHILNGVKNGAGQHKSGGIYNKAIEHTEDSDAVVVGFYSASTQGVFTHPGESWHLHIVLENENKAGHLDSYAVGKGATIMLPVINR